jgi:hypothetical protein
LRTANPANPLLFDDELFLHRDFSGPSQHAWRYAGATIPTPGGRARHGMVFDERRGRIVMFGGVVGPNLISTNQMLELDSSIANWTNVATPPGTLPVARGEMAYDAARGRTVMFGNGAGPSFAATVEFDGTSFFQRVGAPGLTTTGRGFVYDEGSRLGVFYGGILQQATHTYGPTPTSLVLRFGSDTPFNGGTCVFATATLPRLDKSEALEWQVGTTRNLRLSGLPPQNEAVFVLASFGAALPPISVPFAPGCFQHVANPSETLPMLLNAGQSQVLQAITIPNNPAFLGSSVFFQALVTDSNPANPRGLALSNGVRLQVGAL